LLLTNYSSSWLWQPDLKLWVAIDRAPRSENCSNLFPKNKTQIIYEKCNFIENDIARNNCYTYLFFFFNHTFNTLKITRIPHWWKLSSLTQPYNKEDKDLELFIDLIENMSLTGLLFIFVGPIKRTIPGWKNVQTYPTGARLVVVVCGWCMVVVVGTQITTYNWCKVVKTQLV